MNLRFNFYLNINHKNSFDRNMDPNDFPEYIKKHWDEYCISIPDLKFAHFSEWEFLKNEFGEEVLEDCPLLAIDRIS